MICATRWIGKGRSSDLSIDVLQYDVYEIEDGKIIRATLAYPDKESARAAVNASSSACGRAALKPNRSPAPTRKATLAMPQPPADGRGSRAAGRSVTAARGGTRRRVEDARRSGGPARRPRAAQEPSVRARGERPRPARRMPAGRVAPSEPRRVPPLTLRTMSVNTGRREEPPTGRPRSGGVAAGSPRRTSGRRGSTPGRSGLRAGGARSERCPRPAPARAGRGARPARSRSRTTSARGWFRSLAEQRAVAEVLLPMIGRDDEVSARGRSRRGRGWRRPAVRRGVGRAIASTYAGVADPRAWATSSTRPR